MALCCDFNFFLTYSVLQSHNNSQSCFTETSKQPKHQSRNNSRNGWSQEVAKTLDFSGDAIPQAGTSKSVPKRKPQIVKSDALFLYLAQVIDANLKDEEGSEIFGPVLQDKGAKGKGQASDKLLEFINASTHPLCNGKTTTVQTLRGWMRNARKPLTLNEEETQS